VSLSRCRSNLCPWPVRASDPSMADSPFITRSGSSFRAGITSAVRLPIGPSGFLFIAGPSDTGSRRSIINANPMTAFQNEREIQPKVTVNSARTMISRALMPASRRMLSIIVMPIRVVPATSPKYNRRRSHASGGRIVLGFGCGVPGILLGTTGIPDIAPGFGQPTAVQRQVEPHVGGTIPGRCKPESGTPSTVAR